MPRKRPSVEGERKIVTLVREEMVPTAISGVGAAIGTGALWGEQRAAESPLRRGARQLYFGVRRDGTIEFSPKW